MSLELTDHFRKFKSLIKPMFKEFGEVFDLQILRDRITGHSRGCCFVTFFETKSADDAQRALNGIRVLPGLKLFCE
jgi:CUG-BP- and ETR3-like factor